MRRLLRDIAAGRELGDTTTLADAGVVVTIRDASRAGSDDEYQCVAHPIRPAPAITRRHVSAPLTRHSRAAADTPAGRGRRASFPLLWSAARTDGHDPSST